MGVCGSALVMGCPGCGKRHAVQYSCGHKLCGRCASVQRWRKVNDLWPMVKTMKNPRFLTLTFKSRAHLTKEWRKEQGAALRAFFKHRWVKEHIGGGVWAWETTYNQRLKMWHPHFHILFDGDYLPKARVKELWRELSGGAYIIKVQEILGHGERGKLDALRETVKYITKAVEIVEDERLVAEFLDATAGTRRLGVFGKFHGYKPPTPPATDKSRWVIDPFTGRGPREMECPCGFKGLPQFWERVGMFWTLKQAVWIQENTRGKPDPVAVEDLRRARDAAAEAARELTFEEVFS